MPIDSIAPTEAPRFGAHLLRWTAIGVFAAGLSAAALQRQRARRRRWAVLMHFTLQRIPMKCDSKTMLTVAAAVTLAAALAYFTLPAAQAFILASAPLLVALICPVAMLFMMKATHGDKKDQARETDEPKQAPRMHEAARDEG